MRLEDGPEEKMSLEIGNKLTPEEVAQNAYQAKVSGMTNVDLFDAFEQSIVKMCRVGHADLEYGTLYSELEKRLQRIGFLPLPERLAEIRKARG